jgi:hypothetical protein
MVQYTECADERKSSTEGEKFLEDIRDCQLLNSSQLCSLLRRRRELCSLFCRLSFVKTTHKLSAVGVSSIIRENYKNY